MTNNGISKVIIDAFKNGIALTTDTSILTSIANDYGFKNVFSRQIEALGKKGDVLIIMSTSGKSKNCIRASEVAKKLGLKVIELERSTERAFFIQELHLVDIHEICRKVERAFK